MKKLIITICIMFMFWSTYWYIDLDTNPKTISNYINNNIDNKEDYDMYKFILMDIIWDENYDVMFRLKMIYILLNIDEK